MDALAAGHDAAVQMIDTSVVRGCVFRKNGTVVSLTDGQQFR
jgi:hypothetical protein